MYRTAALETRWRVAGCLTETEVGFSGPATVAPGWHAYFIDLSMHPAPSLLTCFYLGQGDGGCKGCHRNPR
jgi:hypothetical protein